MEKNKKRMIHVSPGPVFEIKTEKLKELSKYYTGDVITSSPKAEIIGTTEVYGFKYNCLSIKSHNMLLLNVKFFIFIFIFAIKKRMRNEKYDFITTYDPLKTGIIGVIMSKIMRSKLVVEVNGVYTSPAEYLDGEERLTVRLKKLIYPIIEKWVLKNADGIKLLFKNQIDPFKSILDKKIVRSFSNLVDIEKYVELPYHDERTILFVGFPFKRKGVDILIKAFKMIAEQFPDWQLKILGWYPQPEALLDCIDNHEQIFYHPPVEPCEMPEQIRRCGIFVLPSRSEAMGRVLLESMAAAKPRIGARVDGIPTVINDGEDGLLFESENHEDLADKIKILIKDQKLRRKMGEEGRRRAMQSFCKEAYWKNMFDFYDQILN